MYVCVIHLLMIVIYLQSAAFTHSANDRTKFKHRTVQAGGVIQEKVELEHEKTIKYDIKQKRTHQEAPAPNTNNYNHFFRKHHPNQLNNMPYKTDAVSLEHIFQGSERTIRRQRGAPSYNRDEVWTQLEEIRRHHQENKNKPNNELRNPQQLQNNEQNVIPQDDLLKTENHQENEIDQQNIHNTNRHQQENHARTMDQEDKHNGLTKYKYQSIDNQISDNNNQVDSLNNQKDLLQNTETTKKESEDKINVQSWKLYSKNTTNEITSDRPNSTKQRNDERCSQNPTNKITTDRPNSTDQPYDNRNINHHKYDISKQYKQQVAKNGQKTNKYVENHYGEVSGKNNDESEELNTKNKDGFKWFNFVETGLSDNQNDKSKLISPAGILQEAEVVNKSINKLDRNFDKYKDEQEELFNVKQSQDSMDASYKAEQPKQNIGTGSLNNNNNNNNNNVFTIRKQDPFSFSLAKLGDVSPFPYSTQSQLNTGIILPKIDYQNPFPYSTQNQFNADIIPPIVDIQNTYTGPQTWVSPYLKTGLEIDKTLPSQKTYLEGEFPEKSKHHRNDYYDKDWEHSKDVWFPLGSDATLESKSDSSEMGEIMQNVSQQLDDLFKNNNDVKNGMNDFPCSIEGSWASQVLGMKLTIAFARGSVHVKLKNTEPPRPTGVITGTWKLQAQSLAGKKGPLVLIATDPTHKKVSTFVGQCRFCQNQDIILGLWTMTRSIRDCSDMMAAFHTRPDIMRRDNLAMYREKKLNQLVEQVKKVNSKQHQGNPNRFQHTKPTNHQKGG